MRAASRRASVSVKNRSPVPHSSSTGRVKRPSRVDTSSRSAGWMPRMNRAVSLRTPASVSSGVTHRW